MPRLLSKNNSQNAFYWPELGQVRPGQRYIDKTINIGINLPPKNYYDEEGLFNDLAKTASVMELFGNTIDPSNLDANGYVLSNPSTSTNDHAYSYISQMNWFKSGVSPAEWVMLWDGEGDPSFFGSADLTVNSSTSGRIQFTVNSPGQLKVRIANINASNHLKNLRIIPLSQEANPTLINSVWLDIWNGLSTLRYLDPQEINSKSDTVNRPWLNTLSEWADRPIDNYYGAQDTGMSIEEIVRISNETDTNPWILIPHRATNEFIQNTAAYIFANLNSHLNVYVEYTNEPWNYLFGQTQWLLYNVSPGYDSAVYNFDQVAYEYATRASNCMTQFLNQFPEKGRVTRVFGTKFWGTSYVEDIEAIDASILYNFDMLAVGYYIGSAYANDNNPTWTKQDYIDALNTQLEGDAVTYIKHHKSVAQKYGMRLGAYEAGQHLVNGTLDQTYIDLFAEVNADPQMRTFYKKMVDLWFQHGGSELLFFNSSDIEFGTLRSQSDDLTTSYKYQGLQDALYEQRVNTTNRVVA
jgi:hypothetical protein